MTSKLAFPHIEDSSPEASALAGFRLAAIETSDARIEQAYIVNPEYVAAIREGSDTDLMAWARKHCPGVQRDEDDDGIVRLSGDRDEVESYAETLCSDYGWRQIDAYGNDMEGSGEQYWVVELERES